MDGGGNQPNTGDGGRSLRQTSLNDKGKSGSVARSPTIRPTTEQALGFDEAQSLLTADAATGLLYWRSGRRVGRVAGAKNDRGYILVAHGGRNYRAHRLIWLLTHGQWPAAGLDHANGDRSDNRLSNLRECDQSQNMENVHKRKRSACGFFGTSYDAARKRYKASIVAQGKRYALGYFKTGEAAEAAYEAAKVRFHRFADETALSPLPTMEAGR